MGIVGGWNPDRAQVGSVRGVMEDGQFFVVAGAEALALDGFGA